MLSRRRSWGRVESALAGSERNRPGHLISRMAGAVRISVKGVGYYSITRPVGNGMQCATRLLSRRASLLFIDSPASLGPVARAGIEGTPRLSDVTHEGWSWTGLFGKLPGSSLIVSVMTVFGFGPGAGEIPRRGRMRCKATTLAHVACGTINTGQAGNLIGRKAL